MEIEIQLTPEPVPEKISPPAVARASRPFDKNLKLAGGTPAPLAPGDYGAWLEFRGVVRGEENGQAISALEYEAYPEMAEREIRRLLQEISARHPCLAAKVIHRVGVIPAGETAIYVGVASPHRGEAIALLAEFMDRLKQDVPIWKRGTRSAGLRPGANQSVAASEPGQRPALLSLDKAMAEIRAHGRPLPAVRAPLAEAFGRVLRETVCAPSDFPDGDRSTRDGYAILRDDDSETFQVVDTLQAADWKPRPLKSGEAVRVATGAALPCANLRVVMQENVERDGDQLRVVRPENSTNIRLRGEDVRQGQPLMSAGTKLNAGALAILATVGNANPLVSPRLHVLHFTTGDEIVPLDQTPKPGQVRDSNSILLRGLLRDFPFDVEQAHLPENFALAKTAIANRQSPIDNADLLLISGGASVGETDFTRSLLEWLGFEIVFSQVNVRPGRPLIFGVNGGAPVPVPHCGISSLAPPDKIRVAFGLPGNPLSHFVCFHLFVATALAGLTGGEPPKFLRGRLAAKLDDAPNPRETLWPARLKVGQASCLSPMAEPSDEDRPGGNSFAPTRQLDGLEACLTLHPLAWASSGDVTCLAETNALIRVPANRGSIEAGTEVDFLPTAAMIGGG